MILKHIEQIPLANVLEWQEKATKHHRVDEKGDQELHEWAYITKLCLPKGTLSMRLRVLVTFAIIAIVLEKYKAPNCRQQGTAIEARAHWKPSKEMFMGYKKKNKHK